MGFDGSAVAVLTFGFLLGQWFTLALWWLSRRRGK
jgi:hypothetical protein